METMKVFWEEEHDEPPPDCAEHCAPGEQLIALEFKTVPRGGGFADLSERKQRDFASRGGKRVHAMGLAHKFTSEEARASGRRGGASVSRDPAHMSAIGSLGGKVVSANREHMAELGRKGAKSRAKEPS